MTNTWIDIYLQEMLARDGGSHLFVLFTAPWRPQAPAMMEQTASQVHSLHAKWVVNQNRGRKGWKNACLEKRPLERDVDRVHFTGLISQVYTCSHWTRGTGSWIGNPRSTLIICQRLHRGWTCPWSPLLLQNQEFSYPFGQIAGPITSYVRFPIEAESKSTFKLKVNNLWIQKALTQTAKAFALYAADVK